MNSIQEYYYYYIHIYYYYCYYYIYYYYFYSFLPKWNFWAKVTLQLDWIAILIYQSKNQPANHQTNQIWSAKLKQPPSQDTIYLQYHMIYSLPVECNVQIVLTIMLGS